MNDRRVPRPQLARQRQKRRVEDGLKLNEIVVLRELARGATQASISRSRHYSRSGVAAMLSRLRRLYGVGSTKDLLRDPRVRAQLFPPNSVDRAQGSRPSASRRTPGGDLIRRPVLPRSDCPPRSAVDGGV